MIWEGKTTENELNRTPEAHKQEPVKLTKKQNLLQGLKYLLFATSAGIIQAGSFTLMNETIRWSYWPSYLIALVLSVV